MLQDFQRRRRSKPRRLKLTDLGELRVEDLLGREQCLQIGQVEEDARVVQGRHLLVELGVEDGERPLGLLQLLLGPRHLGLLALLGRLQRLETVPLTVVVHQLPVPLVDLFLFHSNSSLVRSFSDWCPSWQGSSTSPSLLAFLRRPWQILFEAQT